MAIDFRRELNARYELITKSIEDIEKKSQSFPDGWINTRYRKGKTYYYKVRAYKTVDGKKIYGPWSSVKSYKLK